MYGEDVICGGNRRTEEIVWRIKILIEERDWIEKRVWGEVKWRI